MSAVTERSESFLLLFKAVMPFVVCADTNVQTNKQLVIY